MRIRMSIAMSALVFGAAGAFLPRTTAAPVKPQDTPQQADNLVDPNAEPPKPAAKPAAAADADLRLTAQGEGMYKAYCLKCHGLQMVTPGGGFFDLRTFPLDEKARFVSSVMNGKRAMPAWSSALKPADVEALWAYVASYQLIRNAKSKTAEGK